MALERVAGLIRGRTDEIDGAGPWLTGPTAAVGDGLAGFFPRARELVGRATELELDAARPHARLLAIDLPQVARSAELLYGRNFAGFGLLASGRVTPEIAVASALVFADVGLAGQMDLLAASLLAVVALLADALPLAEAYVAKHPEQRAAIRREGLQALIDRGEVVPFENLTSWELCSATP